MCDSNLAETHPPSVFSTYVTESKTRSALYTYSLITPLPLLRSTFYLALLASTLYAAAYRLDTGVLLVGLGPTVTNCVFSWFLCDGCASPISTFFSSSYL